MAPNFIQLHHGDDQALADEAASGLKAAHAQVSPKFFYDALGSRLFDAITETPEYYPTRTEAALMAQSLVSRSHVRHPMAIPCLWQQQARFHMCPLSSGIRPTIRSLTSRR